MTEPEKPKQRVAGVSDAEADLANSGAAVWTNKFFVATGAIVKIAFLETGGPNEPVYFRTAAVMSIPDAIALKIFSPAY